MAEEELSQSERYSNAQGLFDQAFAEIIVKTFPGFERTFFEQLAGNDKVRTRKADPTQYWEDGRPVTEEDGHA